MKFADAEEDKTSRATGEKIAKLQSNATQESRQSLTKKDNKPTRIARGEA